MNITIPSKEFENNIFSDFNNNLKDDPTEEELPLDIYYDQDQQE